MGYGLGHYAGYYGYPYAAAYGTYGNGIKSAPCVNAANVPVPCARKRRDADADAEADADAAYYYGGYYGGYPYGYGYGYGLGGYYGGYYGVHPSHYGICHNNLGARVPC